MQAYRDWSKNDAQYQQSKAYASQVRGNRGKNEVRLTQGTDGQYSLQPQQDPSGTSGTKMPPKAISPKARRVARYH